MREVLAGCVFGEAEMVDEMLVGDLLSICCAEKVLRTNNVQGNDDAFAGGPVWRGIEQTTSGARRRGTD